MLAEEILAYLAKARQSPAFASDPVLLDSLEKSARNSMEGAVAALHAPVASDTWEARATLLGAAQQSERIPVRIPYESVLVGLYPSVVPMVGNLGPAPTLNDIDVSVDIDNKETITSAQGVTVPGSTVRDGTFVTLGSLSVQTPRLTWLVLDKVSNDIGVTYRWKLGPGVHGDTLVSLAFFIRPLRRANTGRSR